MQIDMQKIRSIIACLHISMRGGRGRGHCFHSYVKIEFRSIACLQPTQGTLYIHRMMFAFSKTDQIPNNLHCHHSRFARCIFRHSRFITPGLSSIIQVHRPGSSSIIQVHHPGSSSIIQVHHPSSRFIIQVHHPSSRSITPGLPTASSSLQDYPKALHSPRAYGALPCVPST